MPVLKRSRPWMIRQIRLRSTKSTSLKYRASSDGMPSESLKPSGAKTNVRNTLKIKTKLACSSHYAVAMAVHRLMPAPPLSCPLPTQLLPRATR